MVTCKAVVLTLARAKTFARLADDPETGGHDTWIGPGTTLVELFAEVACHDLELLEATLVCARRNPAVESLIRNTIDLVAARSPQ